MATFGKLLYRLLKAADLSVTDFAGRVATTKGRVSKVGSGQLLPPLDDELETWAAALRLEGDERADFLRCAYIDHAPEPVRLLLRENAATIERLFRELDKLQRQVDELRAQPRSDR